MDEQILEPCPFCGAEASGYPTFEEAHGGTPGCYITCHECACSPDGCYRAADEWPEAVRIWNHRAAHSVIAGKVAELEGELYVISELDGPDKAETVRQIHARARAALAPHPKARNE